MPFGTREAFRAEYGTNHNGRNAFGKCVSTKAERLSQMDRQAAKAQVSAAKRCDAERGTTAESRQAFSDKYGTGRHNRNAFGRCVSALAKAIKDKGAKS